MQLRDGCIPVCFKSGVFIHAIMPQQRGAGIPALFHLAELLPEAPEKHGPPAVAPTNHPTTNVSRSSVPETDDQEPKSEYTYKLTTSQDKHTCTDSTNRLLLSCSARLRHLHILSLQPDKVILKQSSLQDAVWHLW